MEAQNIISPEEQISNLIRSLQERADEKEYPGKVADIRQIVAELAQDWQTYCQGQLQPVDDILPF